jgi:hypothetical protein
MPPADAPTPMPTFEPVERLLPPVIAAAPPSEADWDDVGCEKVNEVCENVVVTGAPTLVAVVVVCEVDELVAAVGELVVV